MGKLCIRRKPRRRARPVEWAGKAAVLGVLERHGDGSSRVRTRIIGGTKRKELFGAMKEEIQPGTNIYTDALPSYASLNHVFVHQFIDHTETYARGAVHTNGIENFWSLVKRCIRGTLTSRSSPSTCSATSMNKRSASTRAR